MSKVIIIGSGLGGLTCGYILQKNGFDVTILEQGIQIGGCLQCFVRRGVKFETGMHFIGSAMSGQTMHRMLRYFGLENLSLSPLDTDGYNTIALQGQNFRIPNGKEAFVERMGSYFPHQIDPLHRYIEIIEQISQASTIDSLTSATRDLAANTTYQLRAINEVLDAIFTDEMLKNVLVGDLPLYAAEKDKTPFSLHAFIMDFYNQSSFRIAGGSDAIAQSLARSIEKMGGQILTKKKAIKVHCNDIKATAVETDTQELFAADYVISTVHPNRLLEMLDTKLIRPAFRTRIHQIPQTAAVFAVYVHFKENTVPYMNTNYYAYSGNTVWNGEHYAPQEWPKSFLYMHMCHKANAQWAQSGVVLAYMNMEEVAQWKGTGIGRRGADYEAFKKQRAERLLAEVEKHQPGFIQSIEHYYTSTPLTYLDYTGTEDGSMYGVAKDIHLGPSGRVPYVTRIPNLYLAGQNVNSHGMLGVIVGTIVTCSELVPASKILKQIDDLEA
jgi:phytoene dehydrogenase-like protein